MTTEEFSSQRRYPVPCPVCGAAAGYPTIVQTVRTQPGRIRIEICCHTCKERWFEEVDLETR